MYVGQFTNILNRMNSYLNNAYLRLKKNKHPFAQALLKYGQANFCLIIIEYTPCGAISMLNEREIFWISILKPYYNILSGGTSGFFGYSHSIETKHKLRNLATNRRHSESTKKKKISKSVSKDNNPFSGLKHSSSSKNKISIAKSNSNVFIYNSYYELLVIVTSVRMLAALIKTNSSTILNFILSHSLFRGGWYFTRDFIKVDDRPKIEDIDSPEFKKLMEDISSKKHVVKAVFVFDAKTLNFVCGYEGVLACAKDLKISHNTITKFIDTGSPYKGYIFTSHRINK